MIPDKITFRPGNLAGRLERIAKLGDTMKTAKTNVYRDGDVWCHATWIDGDFDSSDPLGIPDDATEAEAMDAAREMLSGRVEQHDTNRVEDV